MVAPSSTPALSAFPFLTVKEFRHACCYFLDKIRQFEYPSGLGWSSIRLEEQVMIRPCCITI